MKSPLWILNSSLLMLFIIVIGIIVFTQQKIPNRKSLKTHAAPITPPSKGRPFTVDITHIYLNDLFNTYKQALVPEIPPTLEQLIALPKAPQPKSAPVYLPNQPNFLPPLQAELKGVIYSLNQQDTYAIIADIRTGIEKLYSIGDKIEDAQILRIGQNKIIVIRVNGQEETLFVNNSEAKSDPQYTHDAHWDIVVKRVNDAHYIIDPEKFIERVPSVAHLFDMLNLVTVTYQNRKIGRRIGKLSSQSIGPSLGLQKGDIITAINNISTTTTKQCVEIYNNIKDYKMNDIINVQLIRHNQEITISYILQSLNKEVEEERPQKRMLNGNPLQTDHLEKNVRKRDKNAMVNYGGRNALLKRAV